MDVVALGLTNAGTCFIGSVGSLDEKSIVISSFLNTPYAEMVQAGI